MPGFRGNNIEFLPKSAFGKVSVLNQLNLRRNRIVEITREAFDEFLQLFSLDLSQNNITQIPIGTFKNMVALRNLDLSDNKIEKLEYKTHSVFEDCISLEKLNLSRNKIALVTRKSFPSDPYIPYKLKSVDLSHNLIPILTSDLKHGLKHVEFLNLSHNDISDIHKYIFGNLSSLMVLDLSFNKIDDLNQNPDIFRPGNQLKELYLANNALKTLPWSYLNNLTNLTTLDFANNLQDTIGRELGNLIKKNIRINLENNPFNCDCTMRPIIEFFNKQPDKFKAKYAQLKCVNPPSLTNESLAGGIDYDRLNCYQNNRNKTNHTHEISEIQFREVHRTGNKLKLKWRVNSNEDIGDFLLILRNALKPTRKPYYETIVAYSQRSYELDLGGVAAVGRDEIEMCLLAKDSNDFVRTFNAYQCKHVGRNAGFGLKSNMLFFCFFYLFINNV